MRTSNPLLLAEVDILEGTLDVDANDLTVVKELDKLTEENARLRELVKEFRGFASRQGWEHVLIQQADKLLKGDEDE